MVQPDDIHDNEESRTTDGGRTSSRAAIPTAVQPPAARAVDGAVLSGQMDVIQQLVLRLNVQTITDSRELLLAGTALQPPGAMAPKEVSRSETSSSVHALATSRWHADSVLHARLCDLSSVA